MDKSILLTCHLRIEASAIRMENKNYNVIGVMSGTSLDGLDLAWCRFQQLKTGWKYRILSSITIKYDQQLLQQLATIHQSTAEEISFFHFKYGKWIGEQINSFVTKNKIQQIDFISSHGHTVFHQPQKNFTLQIGDGNAIAATTGKTTVFDFRTLDVALGGQGAPLVPIGDELLFKKYTFCINLGGFANISFKEKNKRIAFDICPVNILLNYLANKEGKDYDDEGKIAASGKKIKPLFEKLNDLSFYKKTPPKSLGREWLEKEVIPLLNENYSNKDILCTCTDHIARQIVNILNDKKRKKSTAFVTGGGAFNKYLIDKIKSETDVEIVLPSREIINYKEALIFAFLGVLRMEQKINILSGVTGASADSCSGSVVLGLVRD